MNHIRIFRTTRPWIMILTCSALVLSVALFVCSKPSSGKAYPQDMAQITPPPYDANKKPSDYVSPCDIVVENGNIYVADHTGWKIIEVDPQSNAKSILIELPEPPSGMALSPDGQVLYVTGYSAQGSVHAINIADKNIMHRYDAGHFPVAPVMDPAGKILYFCNPFRNTVSALDLESGKISQSIKTVREPMSAALTTDGRRLIVADHLPLGRLLEEDVSSVITIIDASSFRTLAAIHLPDGATSVKDIAIDPDNEFAYVVHIMARYNLPATHIHRGWVNTNAVSVIDLKKQQYLNTFLLDKTDRGAANPWSVMVTEDGKNLVVAHAGTHELSIIDRNGLHRLIDQAGAENVGHRLSILREVQRIVPLKGNGPRALAQTEGGILVGEYFSGTLSLVDIHDEKPMSQTITLGDNSIQTQERMGEQLFHDATICYQHWQSCATCHPGEARVDGLNWDLMNDGLGTSKSTKSLLLAPQTPPTTYEGVRANSKVSVRSGLKSIHMVVASEEDASTIDAYLESLEPLPSPYLINGKLSESALRGKIIFNNVGCAACHPAPLYTDMKQYNFGMGLGQDEGKSFDVPTLIEVWRTAPYLHDGRAVTMEEVIQELNEGLHFIKNHKLSEQQLKDLADYVCSL